MNNIVSNVAMNWVGRRLLELGGLGGTLFLLYQGMPPDGQEAVNNLFHGDWQGIKLGTIVTLGLYVYSQFLSWRATTRDQVVADGKKAVPEKSVAAKVAVREVAASTPAKPRNPLEALSNIFKPR